MDRILELNEFILAAALVFVILALICNLVVITGRNSRSRTPVRMRESVEAGVRSRAGSPGRGASSGARGATQAGGPARAGAPSQPGGSTPVRTRRNTGREKPRGLALYATGFTVISFAAFLAYLGIRMSLTGYGPFANQHEFAVSFVLAIVGAYIVAEFVYQIRALSLVVLPVAAALTLYAMSQDTSVRPLIPALQNNLLLTLHVGFAIFAYGAACVSFGAAIVYLAYPHMKVRRLPARDVFDDIGYKAATVTFPLLTLMIVLGSVWANTAWGRYWGWDPKETAALVTWLIYGAYLHARVTRGWQGKRSAWLLVLGFVAILFAYFGNHFFGGLHSYA